MLGQLSELLALMIQATTNEPIETTTPPCLPLFCRENSKYITPWLLWFLLVVIFCYRSLFIQFSKSFLPDYYHTGGRQFPNSHEHLAMPYHQSAAQSSESGTNSSIQLQTIHSRYVSDPKKLSKLLKEHYGPGNYTVEVNLVHQTMPAVQESNLLILQYRCDTMYTTFKLQDISDW